LSTAALPKSNQKSLYSRSASIGLVHKRFYRLPERVLSALLSHLLSLRTSVATREIAPSLIDLRIVHSWRPPVNSIQPYREPRIYFMPWLIVVEAARQTDFSSAGDRARIGLNPVNPVPIWTNHHIVVLA